MADRGAPVTADSPDGAPPDQSDSTVAAVLQQLRSGVRQRQAEAATTRAGLEGATRRILDLRQREFVREPEPLSHRAGWGRLIVIARKGVYKLFGRWWGRAVLEQQNAFNQSASQTLQELLEEHQRAAERLRALESRLATAEERLRAIGRSAPDGPG